MSSILRSRTPGFKIYSYMDFEVNFPFLASSQQITSPLSERGTPAIASSSSPPLPLLGRPKRLGKSQVNTIPLKHLSNSAQKKLLDTEISKDRFQATHQTRKNLSAIAKIIARTHFQPSFDFM
jgi:hypothetical protein